MLSTAHFSWSMLCRWHLPASLVVPLLLEDLAWRCSALS